MVTYFKYLSLETQSHAKGATRQFRDKGLGLRVEGLGLRD